MLKVSCVLIAKDLHSWLLPAVTTSVHWSDGKSPGYGSRSSQGVHPGHGKTP